MEMTNRTRSFNIAATSTVNRFTYARRHWLPINRPAKRARIEVQDQAIRWTLGNRRLEYNPATSGFGFTAAAGDVIELRSAQEIATFTFIRSGAQDANLHVAFEYDDVPNLQLSGAEAAYGNQVVEKTDRTLLFSDFRNVPDTTLLEDVTSLVGPVAQIFGGVWTINAAGRLQCDANPHAAGYDVGTPDVVIHSEVHRPNDSQGGGGAVAFRIKDNDNYLIAKLEPHKPNPEMKIQIREAAVWTTLASVRLFGDQRTVPDFYAIKLILKGPQITAQVEGNSALRLTIHETRFMNEKIHGYHSSFGSPPNHDQFDFLLIEEG